MIRKILIIAAIATMLVTTGCSKSKSSPAKPEVNANFPDGYWKVDRIEPAVSLPDVEYMILEVLNNGATLNQLLHLKSGSTECDVEVYVSIASNGAATASYTGAGYIPTWYGYADLSTQNPPENTKLLVTTSDTADGTEYMYATYLGASVNAPAVAPYFENYLDTLYCDEL